MAFRKLYTSFRQPQNFTEESHYKDTELGIEKVKSYTASRGSDLFFHVNQIMVKPTWVHIHTHKHNHA